MRITNNMIVQNTKGNINGNKVYVDAYNTQMTTQKKISKPSEDPVIAIRSLRLGTNLSHVNQYVDNNIPDARSWLQVTETALTNMKSILTDIRTQCVNGSTDTLTADDRKTILDNLSALADQIYTEGNADYAGRTVFTGYRTDSTLTFGTEQKDVSYNITQSFSYKNLEEHRYYTGVVDVPETLEKDNTGAITTPDCATEISEHSYDRIRLAYNKTDQANSLEVKSQNYNLNISAENFADVKAGNPVTVVPTKVKLGADNKPELDANGNLQYENIQDAGVDVKVSVKVYESEADWENAGGAKTVGENEVVYLEETGEFIFGEKVSASMKNATAEMTVNYDKTGFDKGEAAPEYYYDCVRTSPDGTKTEFTKEDQIISYDIANSTTLVVNTQASDVFDTSIARDVQEMMNVVQNAINANAKVDTIKAMMQEERYSGEEDQKKLQTYLDVAQKEADYADDNLQKTYGKYITKFDGYLQRTNEAITNVGNTMSRLSMTQTRVENQKTTIKELKSSNEDRDISDIIIDYTASYNAYQASLQAASKVNQQTLLNYL